MKHIFAFILLTVLFAVKGNAFWEVDFSDGEFNYVYLSKDSRTVGVSRIVNLDTTEVVVPASVNDGEDVYTITDICQGAFVSSKIEQIALPHTITTIEEDAFFSCKELKQINFPERLKIVGYRAFWGCDRLVVPALPESIEEVGAYAFSGCLQIEKAAIRCGISYGAGVYRGCSKLQNVKIEEGIRTIPDFMFDAYVGPSVASPAVNIAESVLPNTVDTIGNSAFRKWNLEQLEIPDGCRVISDGAFALCLKLERTTLPETIDSLGDRAFFGCTSLKELTIPSRVRIVSARTFDGCRNLTKLVIKGGKIVRKTMPESQEMAYPSYHTCPNLKVLVLGKDVTSVDYTMAAICPNVEVVRCESPTPPDKGFYVDGATLYVPVGSKVFYEQAGYWKKYGDRIVEDEALGVKGVVSSGDKTDIPAYDLQGRRVKNGQKGFAIRGGRKYVAK